MEEQNQIEWDNLLRGGLILKWGKAQTVYLKQQKLQSELAMTHEFEQALTRNRPRSIESPMPPTPSTTEQIPTGKKPWRDTGFPFTVPQNQSNSHAKCPPVDCHIPSETLVTY